MLSSQGAARRSTQRLGCMAQGAKAPWGAATVPGAQEEGPHEQAGKAWAPASTSEMSAASSKEGAGALRPDPTQQYPAEPPTPHPMRSERPVSAPHPQDTLAQALCHPLAPVRLPEACTPKGKVHLLDAWHRAWHTVDLHQMCKRMNESLPCTRPWRPE